MIWSLTPIGILGLLVVIDWAVARRAGRRWVEPACGCARPDPVSRDARFASRCRTCGCLWDAWTGAPLDHSRQDER